MGDLTKNISRRELACNCGCGFDSMDWETINAVQECCDRFSESMGGIRIYCEITSAARCLAYNLRVGSNNASQHPKARAIDFKIRGVAPKTIYDYLNTRYSGRYGIGLYPTFVHLDTRTNGPARWGA